MTDLVARALKGERVAIAKLISLAEAGGEAAKAPLADVYQAAGNAHVVGITGAPGAGKSTLVNALARDLRAANRTVGIVAIDPSSPFSGGAVLGDRVRMGDLAGDDGVFIRSLATQGMLGGLARPTLDAVDVLDAAGFDVILIETVGVGQDEVDIAKAAQTVIVASPPGLGDGIQAIKAGVLEIADIHVVTKGDRPGADKTATELTAGLDLGLKGRRGGTWQVPVLLTSAQTGAGVAALCEVLDQHRGHLQTSGEGTRRRQDVAALRVRMALEELIRRRVMAGAETGVLKQVLNRTLDPQAAAESLLKSAAATL